MLSKRRSALGGAAAECVRKCQAAAVAAEDVGWQAL